MRGLRPPPLPATRGVSLDTVEFFQRVLPQSGYYAAIVINKGAGPRQGFHDTQEALSAAVLRLDQGGNNTYFAVNSFVVKGSRKQDNVAFCRSLYIDIDCGPDKPFPSYKEGLIALGDFIKATGLPAPLVISSGVGLHAYWTLERDLTRDEWQPLANALKAACAVHKFKIDVAVPADSARVLRPIGTHNPKNGKEVKALIVSKPTTTAEMTRVLSPYGSAAPQQVQHTPQRMTLLNNLAVRQEFPPVHGDVVTDKCQQMNWITTHQDKVDEPTWYAMLGIAAHTTDPDFFAVHWSDQHPGFDRNKTLAKLQQWKAKTTGPTLCAKFEELRPGGCKGCKFKEKIGTPARLGVQYEEAAAPADAPVPQDDILPLPFPFKRTATGIKRTIDGTDISVCDFDIVPLSYGYDEGLDYEVVRYSWNRQHKGWVELSFRQSQLAEGNRDFATTIGDKGIVLPSRKVTEDFQYMLRSYMDELRKQRAMTNHYSSFGWKEGRKEFLLGTELYRMEDDGTVSRNTIVTAKTVSKVADSLYTTAGTLKRWVDFTTILDKLNMPVHKYILGLALAAPLFEFTGLKGLTVSLYGETGTGKSLAQLWMQSVWGNPTELHYSAKFTLNALYSRMALLKNLPCTVDETTLLEDKDISDLVYSTTQGRDKARLTQSATEREARTWGLPLVLSTNRSLTNSIWNAGAETDAQLARFIEITMPINKGFMSNPAIGRAIYTLLTENYGHVGHAFLAKLMELGHAGIMAAIKEAIEKFPKKYNVQFSGSERFWEAGVVLPDLALTLAKQWGLIKFDWEDAINLVIGELGQTRTGAKAGRTDCFDLLAEFLNDMGRTVATVMHTKGMDAVLDTSVPLHGEIRARYDLYRPGVRDPFTHGTLTLDKRAFREWITRRRMDYKTFLAELEQEGVNATPPSGKASMGKDTPFRLGQSYAIVINLNHPRLAGALVPKDDIQDLTLGQMQVVK